jgi:outer membrane protein assembly factor BamB
MTRPERRMVDVELVEARLDEPDAAAVERPQSASRRGRRLASTAVLLVVGVVLALSVRDETADERADAALLAVFADVTGIATSLREPLTDPWRLAVPVPGVALVITQEEHFGRTRTTARDVVTGRTRWLAPESVDVAGRGAHCPASAAGGTLLVCQVFGEPGQGGPTTDAVLGGTPDRLVVLAADDGRVVAERELGTTTIGWAVLDDDLVVASRVEARADVERSGVLDGQVRWRTRVPLPREALARQMQLTAGAFVVLTGPAAAVIDAGTGDLIGTWAASGGGPVQVATSTIGFSVWTSPREGIWFDRHGAAGARLPGAPVVPAVDDGSLPGVVILQDADVLRAVDVHAGILWERPRVQRAPVRLDGVVVLEDDDGLRATDLASGTQRWSVQAATASLGGTVLTDGLRLLTVGRDAVGARILSAYDLRDGSLAWTTAVPGPAP